jgi:multiple sugar transport system substrate-binding protein
MSVSSRLSRRNFLRISAGAAATGFLVACTPAAPAQQSTTATTSGEAAPAGDTVNLRFLTNHGEADQPLFKQVLEEFASREPNITIEHLDIAGEDFYTSVNTQGAAGQLPDVFYTRTFDVPVYASKQWTISLQPYADRDAEEVNVEDFWPAELAQMQWNGELYALPYDFSNVGIYYNKSMFDAAGVAYPTNDDWNWNDLLQTALPFVKQEGGNSQDGVSICICGIGFSTAFCSVGVDRFGRKISRPSWATALKISKLSSGSSMHANKGFIRRAEPRLRV